MRGAPGSHLTKKLIGLEDVWYFVETFDFYWIGEILIYFVWFQLSEYILAEGDICM